MPPLTLLLFLFGLTCSQVVLADQVSEAIVGGDYAEKGHFKYQVSVQFEKKNCGGTIIAEHYILTAAHCVTDEHDKIKIQEYVVVAGTHYLRDVKHVDTAETVYIHKHFHHRTARHDFAILKLTHGFDISHHHEVLGKVELPKGNEDLVGKEGLIAGFGLQSKRGERNKAGQWIELGGTRDGRLKYARARVVSHEKCANAYPLDVIHESLFCAQVHQRPHHEYEGVCDGDSGSGLVHGNEVIGILNGSPIACNESARPAVYTRVGSYLNLINSVLEGKPDKELVHANVPHL